MSNILFFLTGLYFFLFPLGNILIVEEGLTILPVFGFLTIFIFITCLLLSPKIIQLEKSDIFLALFIILAGLAAVTHANAFDGLQYLFSNIQLAFFYILLRSIVKTNDEFFTLCTLIILSLSLAATLMILERYQFIHLGMKTIEAAGVTRTEGLSGGTNQSSFYFSMGILLCIGFLSQVKEIFLRVLLFIAIFLLSLGNFFTYSITGFLALMLGLIILFFRGRSLLHKTFFLIVFLFLSITMTTLNPRVSEKIDQIRTSDFVYWGSTRGATWLSAVNAIRNHPWLGVGAAQFPLEIVDFFNEFLERQGEAKAAHNIYLAITGETGLIGLFFFLAFLKVVTLKVWNYYKKYQSRFAFTFVAMLVTMFFMGLTLDLQRDKLFWMMLGLAAALTNMPFNQSAEKVPHFNQFKLNPALGCDSGSAPT